MGCSRFSLDSFGSGNGYKCNGSDIGGIIKASAIAAATAKAFSEVIGFVDEHQIGT
tara:strand:+ start:499 stop:666 length:168 start_codon:yes stop_codon:yes gene_type:complete